MKIICVLLLCLILSACSTSRIHPGSTIEEDVLFKRLALLMSGMSYDMVCNGRAWESYKDFKNPDNVRLSSNRKVLISRLHYLWRQRHPELPPKDGLEFLYLGAAQFGDIAEKAIRADGCESRSAKEAQKSLVLFSKSEPEAVNAATNEYISRAGGFITAVK